MNEAAPPAAWIARWVSQIESQGTTLDVACGAGRHTKLLLERGYKVVAVDVDIGAMAPFQDRMNLKLIQADLENGPWPFPDGIFHGIVVTNYLHRPLFPRLMRALRPGGIFIYETFARGNAEFGRPSNPDFLLQPGELLRVVEGKARVIAYEDVYIATPKPALVQRICAVADGGTHRHFPTPGN